MKRGIAKYGVGSGAAHLVCGHSRAHHALEEALAAFTGRERALLFSTGYAATMGMASTLAGPGDVIVLDADSHASIYDGVRLGGAEVIRFKHNDPDDLAKARAAMERALLRIRVAERRHREGPRKRR